MHTNLKLASWNVNSIHVRAPQVLEWFTEQEVDVLAIQETKVVDAQFPQECFTEQGLHLAFSGQKTYNGVAFVSRHPMSDIFIESDKVSERRIIAATVHGIRIINLYVPNGSHLGSDKYIYKLSWLQQVSQFIASELERYPYLAVVGDFNIAPQDLDVHDPQEWLNCILCSPAERSALDTIQNLGFQDSFRVLHPQLTAYSWWDYRAASFRRNRGLRIDLILLSNALQTHCDTAGIDKTPRQSERPSDHAPVWATVKAVEAQRA